MKYNEVTLRYEIEGGIINVSWIWRQEGGGKAVNIDDGLRRYVASWGSACWLQVECEAHWRTLEGETPLGRNTWTPRPLWRPAPGEPPPEQKEPLSDTSHHSLPLLPQLLHLWPKHSPRPLHSTPLYLHHPVKSPSFINNPTAPAQLFNFENLSHIPYYTYIFHDLGSIGCNIFLYVHLFV